MSSVFQKGKSGAASEQQLHGKREVEPFSFTAIVEVGRFMAIVCNGMRTIVELSDRTGVHQIDF